MLPDDTRIVENEIEKRIFNGSFETGGEEGLRGKLKKYSQESLFLANTVKRL